MSLSEDPGVSVPACRKSKQGGDSGFDYLFVTYLCWKWWSEASKNFKRKSKVAETSALEISASQYWVIHFHISQSTGFWERGTNRTIRIHFSPREQCLLLCRQVCNPAQQSLFLTWLVHDWYQCLPCCSFVLCTVKDWHCWGEKQAAGWRRHSSEDDHKIFGLFSNQTKGLCVCAFRSRPHVLWFDKSISPETNLARPGFQTSPNSKLLQSCAA